MTFDPRERDVNQRTAAVSTFAKYIAVADFDAAFDWLNFAEATDPGTTLYLAWDMANAVANSIKVEYFDAALNGADPDNTVVNNAREPADALRGYVLTNDAAAAHQLWAGLPSRVQRDVLTVYASMIVRVYELLTGRTADEECNNPACPVHGRVN